jgi:hypothetical protein
MFRLQSWRTPWHSPAAAQQQRAGTITRQAPQCRLNRRKKRLRNLIAVRIVPGNHGIHVPTLAFKDYVIASKEPAIFTRSPIIAFWAPQPRKRPTPDFADALSSEPYPQNTP